jgi:ADP-ribose pyrophosphatase YjhB (NUDIX family)
MVKGVDYIGVGVGAMVFDSSGHVFLAKRGPRAQNERNRWEFPGGAVQLHERIRDAIKREFIEEYGMVIEPKHLLCVADHILPVENQHWVSLCFIARHMSGEPRVLEPEKCHAIRWCHINDLPSPLTLISSSFLREYRAAYGESVNPCLDKRRELIYPARPQGRGKLQRR